MTPKQSLFTKTVVLRRTLELTRSPSEMNYTLIIELGWKSWRQILYHYNIILKSTRGNIQKNRIFESQTQLWPLCCFIFLVKPSEEQVRRRRGIFGFQPGIFHVTQLMNYENILFSNIDSTFKNSFASAFQIRFCFYSTTKTQLTTRGLTRKND